MKVKFLVATALFSALFFSCKKDDDNGNNEDDFDRRGMLDHLGSKVIIPKYNSAAEQMKTLRSAFEDFTSQPNSTTLNAAKNQFKAAYLSWQQISMLEIGPADQEAIKGNVNIFPTDTSKIENNIANGLLNLDVLSNNDAKGFPAIDFLLFSKPESTTINLFSSGSNAGNRKDYLTVLGLDIQEKVQKVNDAWAFNSGNYHDVFINQAGTDVGSSLGTLVNAFNEHYEVNFRDGKIGIPVGVRSLGIAIPEKSEAFYSGISVLLALENLTAMEDVFLGRDQNGVNGKGLDDHLIALEATQLATDITGQFATVRTALEKIPDPLATTINTNQNLVEEAYQEIQKLIVLLKIDMPSRLGVLITYQDNDGD